MGLAEGLRHNSWQGGKAALCCVWNIRGLSCTAQNKQANKRQPEMLIFAEISWWMAPRCGELQGGGGMQAWGMSHRGVAVLLAALQDGLHKAGLQSSAAVWICP